MYNKEEWTNKIIIFRKRGSLLQTSYTGSARDIQSIAVALRKTELHNNAHTQSKTKEHDYENNIWNSKTNLRSECTCEEEQRTCISSQDYNSSDNSAKNLKGN